MNPPSGAGRRTARQRVLVPRIPCPWMLVTGLFGTMVLLACPGDRYTRPAGPAPRYESAPLAPWANETTSEPGSPGDGSLEGEIERALAADAGPGTD